MTELQIMREADLFIMKKLQEELREQGHYLTGGLERNMIGVIETGTDIIALKGYAPRYSGILNTGVPATRIPFGGSTGAGGTSKYIQALIAYWKLRGLGPEEAKRAAFATAHKHAKEGMSTQASRRFSSTGQRQGFIGAVDQAAGPQLDQRILAGYDKMVDEHFNKTKSETI